MLKLVLTTDQTGPALRAELSLISKLLHVDVEAVGLDGYVSERVSYLNPTLVEADPGSTPVSSMSVGVGLDPVLVGHDEVTVAEGSGLPSFSELLAETAPAKDVDGVPVDEPHPVLEKADPPSVETVPEPVVPAPAETPAE